MKTKVLISTLVVLLFGTLVYKSKEVSFFKQEKGERTATNEAEEAESLTEPDEQWMLQRMYPSMNPTDALRGYEQFLAQAYSAAENSAARTPFAGTWTQEGPGNVGARYNTIVVHPTNPNIVYAGSAAGGLWKTTDGGVNWNPIFDQRAYLNIGTVILDKTNPNTIYVGTGDPNIGGYVRIGDGVWKSTNGGSSWTNIGLSNTRIISKIVQHPTQPNTLWVAAMGLPFARDANRGVYKTTDGGLTWTKVLYVADDTGASDLIIDPTNPNTLYATSWTRIRNNHESMVMSPNSRVWKSTNGGTAWTPLTTGLPTGKQGRIGLAITRNAPVKIYAMYMDTIDLGFGSLYKTTNSGTSWTELSSSASIDTTRFQGNQSWYFGKVRINPANDNEVWLLGVNSLVSYDGGTSWADGTGEGQTLGMMHSDHHDLAWDNGGNAWLATDGGVFKGNTVVGLASWQRKDNMPTNQVYRCAVNPAVNGQYAVGVQDNGTNLGNAATLNSWTKYWYADGFQMLFHPTDFSVWYASWQNGSLWASYDGGNNFNLFTTGIDPSESHNWDTPFRMSTLDPDRLYTGTSILYKYDQTTGGQWMPISPILCDPINDRFHNITTIEESPLNANTIWVGTSDSHLQVTLNGGTTWMDKNLGLPTAYITSVKPSLHNVATAYVAISGYRENDNTPHLWKTTNNGNTWVSVSGNLPTGAINDIQLYQGNANVLFVATDAGVYGTINGGTTWARIGTNMPTIPVFDLEIDKVNNKLLAGTFARSLMSFNIGVFLSTTNISTVEKLAIFPNPASRFLQLKNDPANLTDLRIVDMQGNAVLTIENPTQTIDIQKLPVGTYIISVKENKKQLINKFIKID